MKFCLVLGSVLLISAIGARAAPIDDDVSDAPVAVHDAAEADPKPQPPPTVVREETQDEITRHSDSDNIQTQTKDKRKVKVRYDRHGNQIIKIKEVSRTKTKKDELSDDFKQVNHTLSEGGIEDGSSATEDKQHEFKEVDVEKKTNTERIVIDKYGNVKSDTRKTKEKDRTRKKENDKETSSYVHTVKQAPPPAVPLDKAIGAPVEC